MVTGNGWYLTKHSASVWSTEPRPGGAPTSDAGADVLVGAEPTPVTDTPSGEAAIDAYTVTYARDGAPESAVLFGHEIDGGARFVANTPTERSLLESLDAEEAVGRRGQVRQLDGKNLFEPA